MKKLLYIVLPLLLIGCSDDILDDNIIDDFVDSFETTKTTNQISIPNGLGVQQTLNNVQLNFHLNKNNQEYFVFGSKGYESVILKRNNLEWTSHIIEDTRIHGGRNYRIIDDTRFIISGTGETSYIPYDEWVDHLYVGTFDGNGLSYEQISENKAYYHGVSVGDITNDGLYDIVSNDGLIFIQEQGQFEDYDYINNNPTNPIIDTDRMKELGNPIEPKIVDLFPGGRPEIIYGFVDDNDMNKGEVLIYEYSDTTTKYEVVSEITSTTLFGKQVNSFQVSDFNLDGYNDIAVLRWGYSYDDTGQMLDVWLGNSDKSFTKSFEKLWPLQGLQSAQFKLYDVNGDGFDDIVFIPFGGQTNPNNEWRYHSSDEYNNGVYINKLVMLNDTNGGFKYLNKEIIIKDIGDVSYLIPFMRNNNLCFLTTKGILNNDSYTVDITDIEISKQIW